MSIVDRLRQLGIELPAPPTPVATFDPIATTGDLILTSGQIATSAAGGLVATGRVGAEVDLDQARDCARACALNVLAQLDRAPGGLDRLDRVVKLTVFVASAPGFSQQHVVADGASDLLVEVLGERGRHARSAVGVAALPLESPVEIEAIVRWLGE